jgi:hypothetical protein
MNSGAVSTLTIYRLNNRPLAMYRSVKKNKNPAQNAGSFRWKTFTYCLGSTLSNTRFANNELSSINC